MKSDDLITILVRLTHRFYDFANEQSSFTYEFSDRLYEITFKRMKGQLDSFSIRDMGEVVKCES